MTFKKNFSIELKNILSYAIENLGKEIPSQKLGVEYILLSILDNTNCYANAILNNNITSTSLKALSDTLFEKIGEKTNISSLQIEPIFDEHANSIIEKSEDEANDLKDTIINSEHLLLSILKNDSKYSNALNELGINYDFIKKICLDKKDTKNNNKDNNKKRKAEGIKKLQKKQENDTQSNQNQNKNNQVILNNRKNVLNLQGAIDNGSFIENYTTNISLKCAMEGCIYIGREDELNKIITILSRKTKSNVLIVGENGCGKTKLCYKLADMINKGDVPTWLQNKEILMLNPMALVSGTTLRGMFEQRINGLFNELAENDKYILLLDNMQQMLSSVSKDKDSDLSEVLANILDNDDVKVLGTLTHKDYKNCIEYNSNLISKFQTITLEENTEEETFEILKSIKEGFENYHTVRYSDEVLKYIVELSHKYIRQSVLPDSAIDIMDTCGASKVFVEKFPKYVITLRDKLKDLCKKSESALSNYDFELWQDYEEKKSKVIVQINQNLFKMQKNKERYAIDLTKNDVDNVISNITNIPVSKLNESERDKVIHLNDRLKESIIGQDEAIDTICKSIKRNSVGLSNDNRPINVSLLIGPTGVGKTLLAKKLAKEVFGDENALLRIDMSEFSEKSSVSKLIGTNQGYVGYGDMNMLTDKVKSKPYCLILLDEIEKANEEVFNLLLQVFDEGRLTDGRGITVSFKKCIILMTSNVGARESDEMGKGIGFKTSEKENKERILEKALKRKFNPEFINRIDSILYFSHLTDENIKNIIKLELNYLNEKLSKKNLSLNISDDLIDIIYKKSIEQKNFGARPIKRFISEVVEDKLVDLMLENDFENKTFEYDAESQLFSYK